MVRWTRRQCCTRHQDPNCRVFVKLWGQESFCIVSYHACCLLLGGQGGTKTLPPVGSCRLYHQPLDPEHRLRNRASQHVVHCVLRFDRELQHIFWARHVVDHRFVRRSNETDSHVYRKTADTKTKLKKTTRSMYPCPSSRDAAHSCLSPFDPSPNRSGDVSGWSSRKGSRHWAGEFAKAAAAAIPAQQYLACAWRSACGSFIAELFRSKSYD